MAEQLDLFPETGLPQYVGKVSKHPLYRVWVGMLTRCRNPNVPEFVNYGGRGITVDPRFLFSRAFVAWGIAKGWAKGLDLDRRDNDGPYSPENCRFVARLENACNRRNTRYLPDGRTFGDVARASGLRPGKVLLRLHRGMSSELAVSPHDLRGRYRMADGRSLRQACREAGIAYETVRYRVKRGMTPDEAVLKPLAFKRSAAYSFPVADKGN